MSATHTRLSAISAIAPRTLGGVRPRGARRFVPADVKSGFTLLEVLAVIGLIALLTGLVIGAGRRATDTGKAARARAELVALAATLDAYKFAHGDFPRTDDAARLLQSLIGRRGPDYQPVTARSLIDLARFVTDAGADPFSVETAVLLDPWGQPYRYAYKSQAPWTNHGYVLYTAGPDSAASDTLLAGGFPNRAAAGNADNVYTE